MAAVVVLIPTTTDASQAEAADSRAWRRSPSRSPSKSSSTARNQPRPSPQQSSRLHHLQPSRASTSASALSSSSSHSSSSSASASDSRSKRSTQRYQPIDLCNPFGEDAHLSAKRAAPSTRGPYVCRWRIRDKKGLLDAEGHLYCRCKLMTADLLAKHVLSHHLGNPAAATTQHVPKRIACRWDRCFNRHYEPAELAAHLVHDHLTCQMGLKYACSVDDCPANTILISRQALERHHAQYHSGNRLPQQLRPVWQPQSVKTDKKHASRLLSELRKLDASSLPTQVVRISVSDRVNPKHDITSPALRRERELDYKQQYMDHTMIQPGPGQDGEPWISLHRRLERSARALAERHAADQAVFGATTYDDDDLLRARLSGPQHVEVSEPPALAALKEAILSAQPYIAPSGLLSPSSVARPELSSGAEMPVVPQQTCQVLAPEASVEDRIECIGPASLLHIEREMHFDAALSKQRRWADKVLGLRPAPPHSLESAGISSQEDASVDGLASDYWAPPILLEAYHPSSRIHFPTLDDSRAQEGRCWLKSDSDHSTAGAQTGSTSSSSKTLDTSSTAPTSASLLGECLAGPISTSPTQYGPSEAVRASILIKREREDDPLSDAYNGCGPPALKRASRHSVRGGLAGMYLDASASAPKTEAAFVELEANPRGVVEYSPRLVPPLSRPGRRS